MTLNHDAWAQIFADLIFTKISLSNHKRVFPGAVMHVTKPGGNYYRKVVSGPTFCFEISSQGVFQNITNHPRFVSRRHSQPLNREGPHLKTYLKPALLFSIVAFFDHA